MFGWVFRYRVEPVASPAMSTYAGHRGAGFFLEPALHSVFRGPPPMVSLISLAIASSNRERSGSADGDFTSSSSRSKELRFDPAALFRRKIQRPLRPPHAQRDAMVDQVAVLGVEVDAFEPQSLRGLRRAAQKRESMRSLEGLAVCGVAFDFVVLAAFAAVFTLIAARRRQASMRSMTI